MSRVLIGKDGRRYNPDRTKWKESMKRRRERLAALYVPPPFICNAACFSHVFNPRGPLAPRRGTRD